MTTPTRSAMPFGGTHCETSALRKRLAVSGFAVSEAMLFGLGGGIGFMFLERPDSPGFVGGRNGPFPLFTTRMAGGIGLAPRLVATADPQEGYRLLLAELAGDTPVICYGDLFYLPYFQASRHFGGHAFLVYAVDEATDQVLISDRSALPRAVCRADLARARGSQHQPFPPRHAILTADFAAATAPTPTTVRTAIHATAAALAPPAGGGQTGLIALERFGHRLADAVRTDPAECAVDRLVRSFIDLHLAGTGGAAFRPLYRDFLAEAAALLDNPAARQACHRAETTVGAWSDLLETLLPADDALGALRAALLERETALLAGDDQAMCRAAGLTAALPQLRHAAEKQVATCGEQLSRAITTAVRRVLQAERALVDLLREV
jgi:hypothetical protein